MTIRVLLCLAPHFCHQKFVFVPLLRRSVRQNVDSLVRFVVFSFFVFIKSRCSVSQFRRKTSTGQLLSDGSVPTRFPRTGPLFYCLDPCIFFRQSEYYTFFDRSFSVTASCTIFFSFSSDKTGADFSIVCDQQSDIKTRFLCQQQCQQQLSSYHVASHEHPVIAAVTSQRIAELRPAMNSILICSMQRKLSTTQTCHCENALFGIP